MSTCQKQFQNYEKCTKIITLRLGSRNYLKWLGVAAFLMSIVPSTESAALNQNSLEAVGPPDARDAAENILPPYSSGLVTIAIF